LADAVWAGVLRIEMIATTHGAIRSGAVWRGGIQALSSQADMMIISGTVTKKWLASGGLYNQMAEPKYVIAMGACAISGGPFKQGYNV